MYHTEYSVLVSCVGTELSDRVLSTTRYSVLRVGTRRKVLGTLYSVLVTRYSKILSTE